MTTVLFSQSLTIEECQKMARNNYPSIARFDLIEQSTKFNLSNANSAYLPQIMLAAQATWQSDVTKISLNLPITLPLDDILPSPPKDQYKMVADVSQVLWDGGKIEAHKKKLFATASIEREQLETSLYTLNERVNGLFFGILLLDEQLRLQTTLDEELQRNYDKVQSYIKNGVANEADLSTIKVEQLNAKQERIKKETARQAYIKMLSLLIGKNIGQNVELIKPLAVNINSYKQINRPELRLFDAQQSLADSNLGMIKARNMPILGLFVQGGYGKPGLNMFDNRFAPFFIGGLSLSWNFGNIYTSNNEKQEIELMKKNIEIQRKAFLFNLDTQIPQQQIEIERYRRTLEDDDEIIRLRKIIRQAAEAKVENGTMTIADMLRELAAEEAAKQAKALHEIQYLMSIYTLKNTIN